MAIEPCRFCTTIISGGQTGVDRAALDFALQRGYPHAGYCPPGRMAEDGAIPPRYLLQELETGGYRQRTKRNVQESDGTLILSPGECEGGTLATLQFALRFGKPHHVVDLAVESTPAQLQQTLEWIRQHQIERLNVAGPREERCPGVYQSALDYLLRLDLVRG
jgi:predicted Rossmann-fold nucleotide-binding protein